MFEMTRMNMDDDEEIAQPINMASQQGISSGCCRTFREPVAPVTPGQTSGHWLPHIDNTEASPDGGVVLETAYGAYSQLPTNNIFTNHGRLQIATASTFLGPSAFPTSPSRIANIRVRRANNGSTLLQSPARAGHAARMRQIFEDAGRDHECPQPPQPDRGVSYPQLPNISRKASPPAEHSRNEQRFTLTVSPVQHPKSPCMSSTSFRMVSHATQAVSPRVSEQSSESWSDDSGYFIAGSRNRTASLTGPPRDRVNDWLATVSLYEQETCGIENVLDYQSTSHLPRSSSEKHVFNKDSMQSSHQISTITIPDPFLESDSSLRTSPLFKVLPPRRPRNQPHTPTQTQTHSPTTVIIRPHQSQAKCPILEHGGIQLSPLSPNVCIERGPSRYHSTRTSAIKERRAMRYTVNENDNENGSVGLENRKGKEVVDAEVQGSPLAPCKIGVGTRFQHARHGVRGVGRSGRCLES
ncbi:hypothetical protein BKA58DRAFT_90670 [Alternaria rosae]|uniref:uncharacterized protein n=1 Tax=Alternaria rosae TaxID=1187941 RepID=UPI001E8E131E|nr:uncharacterized protein BKA58DRAFT_90670 [Alternaria rosae]KAH6878200.1 hypothetical protein BKA58DRAFT_90670 [Alternaria rosae]